jgi:hypothetical protein
MWFSLHRLGLPLLVYTHVLEAAGQTNIKPGRLATPWTYWLVAFAYYLLMSGTSPG